MTATSARKPPPAQDDDFLRRLQHLTKVEWTFVYPGNIASDILSDCKTEPRDRCKEDIAEIAEELRGFADELDELQELSPVREANEFADFRKHRKSG